MDMKALGFVALLGSLVTGCAGPSAGSVPTPVPTPTHIGRLTLTEADCALERSDGIPRAGRIRLAVFNRTEGQIRVVYGLIATGHTFDELAAYNARAKAAAEAGLPRLGHPSFWIAAPFELGPGGSSTLEWTAATGTHAVTCMRVYGPLADLRPYGLTHRIEVTE